MLHRYVAVLALATTTLVVSGCGEASKTPLATGIADTTASVAATAATTTKVATVPAIPGVNLHIQAVELATGKPLSRSQWIEKGDKICAHLRTELSSTAVKNINDFARVLPTTSAYEYGEYKELAKLVPPASQASSWREWLKAVLQRSTNSARLGRDAASGKLNTNSPLISAAAQASQRADQIAQHAGFKICSHI